MAMETMDAVKTIQFSDMLHSRAQQITSRLRPHVQQGNMTSDTWAYDGIGTLEAREIFGRNNDSTADDIEFNRRKLSRRQFVVTLLVDQYDVEAMLTDPTGKLANECVKAMERVFDHVVVDAMFTDVQTGREFETTVTATSDGVLTVNATGGYTLPKVLEITENFIDNEVGNDTQTNITSAITGSEHSTLLQISQLTSRDYSTQMALEKGSIVSAGGVNFIKFGASTADPVLPVVGGVRTSFAMADGAMFVGIGRATQITLKDRPDKVNMKQIQVTMVMGGVRTEGKLIQKVTTTP